MTNPKFPFHKYAKELSKYADNIDVFEATSSNRKGKRFLRDIFVFWRNTYSEGNYYMGLVKDMLYLFALMPLALIALNLPTTFATVFAILYILICSVIGYVSYRFLALPRREKELEDLMSMSRYLTWDMLKQLQDEHSKQSILIESLIKKKVRSKK